MKKLTEKQQAFVDAKLAGLTHKASAIHAGYAISSAGVAGTQLMQLPHVKAAIQKGKRDAKRPAAKVKKHPQTLEQLADAMGIPEDERPKLKDRYDSPLDFMIDVMNNAKMSPSIRFEAAKQALPYCNARVGEKGKKENQKERAGEVARGKFAPKAAPAIRRQH